MTDEEQTVVAALLPAMRNLPGRAHSIQINAQRAWDMLVRRVERLRSAYGGNGDQVLERYIDNLEAAIVALGDSLEEMELLVAETREHAQMAGLIEDLLREREQLGE